MRRLTYQKPIAGTPVDQGHQLAQRLTGAWLFNEGSGTTAADSGPNGLHGTYTGTALSWSRDNYGQPVLSFAGAEYVLLPARASAVIAGAPFVTVVVRARRSGIGSKRLFGLSVTGSTHKVLVACEAADKFSCICQPSTADTSRTATTTSTYTSLTQWYTFGLVADVANDRQLLYVDGALITTGSSAFTSTEFSAEQGTRAVIGTGVGISNSWLGDIGHVYLWTRELNASEMAAVCADPYQIYRQTISRPKRAFQTI